MPTISSFYGIIIQMYWNDHAPPHFHAIYGEYKATINIEELLMKVLSPVVRATLYLTGLNYIKKNY